MSKEDKLKSLEKIDDELLQLFQKRLQLIEDLVADPAKEKVLGKPGLEREIISRMVDKSPDGMESYTKILFSTLFDISHSYENRLKHQGDSPLVKKIKAALEKTPKLFPTKAIVACQGVDGSYSQLVADRLFSTASIMYFKNFNGVFSAVEKGLCQYGILPIENSTYGTVNEVYDLMSRYRFSIVRTMKYKVNHALLAKPNTSLTDIKEIISHEQALGQCSEFLKKYEYIKVTQVENTGMAAKIVAESDRTDLASISSPEAGKIYNLTALPYMVSNSDSNFTRFICISKNMEIYPGANKVSFIMSLPHAPGSLYKTMAKFSALGLNLTKLESRPITGRDFEFLFYFDMEASVQSEEILSLLNELSAGPDYFMFLGNYSEL